MKKTKVLLFFTCFSMMGIGQNINLNFTGTGAASQIGSITATNLKTNQSITFPGNETLILTVSSGITGINEQAGRVRIFPNPFSGRTTLATYMLYPQTVCLKVQNLVGQVVAQTRKLLQPGENDFSLSIATAGIYLVSLITEQGTTGYKVICTEAAGPENRIRYLGCASTGPNNSINSFTPDLKSTSSGYYLDFTPGDIMLYRCSSGIYTTIVTDSPTASKNYEVDFSACVDLAGKNYSTVRIGDRTWMAENLAFLPAVSPSTTGSETLNHYYVFGYEGTSVNAARAQANYATFGGLYNWPAAMASCPTGWHLPSDAEWTTLTDYLTNNGYGYGGSGSDIGKSMASTSGWTTGSTAGTVGNDQASNNRSGFTALPGGRRTSNGGFDGLGYYAGFWSSSEDGSSDAWYRYLNYDRVGVNRNSYYRSYGFSVRCLQN